MWSGKARLTAMEWGTTRNIVHSHPPTYAVVYCAQEEQVQTKADK
jgi:hypothetical protein